MAHLPAKPDRERFDTARQFIEADITREVQFARENPNGELGPRFNPGGGNVLAALGLLCYTEYGGKLRFDHRKKSNPNWDDSGRNFSDFSDLLGPVYSKFRSSFAHPQDVYRSFRCGLAHEFHIKKHCTVFMVGSERSCGIGEVSPGHYFIAIEPYLRDLLKAFDDLALYLFPPA